MSIEFASKRDREKSVMSYVDYLPNLVKNIPQIKSKIKRRIYSLASLFVMIPWDPITGFDTFSPKYNHVQSAHEVLEWLDAANFQETHFLSENRNHGFRARLLYGDFEGAIYTKSLKCSYTN